MKKTIFTLTTILFIFLISIMGCRKDIEGKEEIQAENLQKRTQMNSLNSEFFDNISVSEFDFLIFPSVEDFNAYYEFIKSSTHFEVQDYLSSINFNSHGASIYTGEDVLNELVSDEQAADYIFNLDRVFQVQDVVMRPINETIEEVKWEFLLAMTTDNLDGGSYQSIANGMYDASIMNQFATNPEEENFDLFEYMINTPSGYEETDANVAQARRPMFGKIEDEYTECGGSYLSGTNDCVKGCQDIEKTTTFIFWIGFPKKKVKGSYTVAAEGC